MRNCKIMELRACRGSAQLCLGGQSEIGQSGLGRRGDVHSLRD